MSREVRRVPMDWQHPQKWDDRYGVRFVPLWTDYPGALARWEEEGRALAARAGSDWEFWSSYCLTGYQGREDTEPTIHPYDGGITVRDEAHLAELLQARHEEERPDPAEHMPMFPDDVPLGYCMYETCTEGTPISPVLSSPEELARWLTDHGASAFGDMTASYEDWLKTCRSGWAPSMVAVGGHVMSGVEWEATR